MDEARFDAAMWILISLTNTLVKADAIKSEALIADLRLSAQNLRQLGKHEAAGVLSTFAAQTELADQMTDSPGARPT